MESKKIIEVFVETDEDESYSSSSDDDKVKVVTKISKTKDSSIKGEGKPRCVDLGGNNLPERTEPQQHRREESREVDRMDTEAGKGGNSNTGVAKQSTKKEKGNASRHLGDSEVSTSSSDSESSDESGDSADTAQPENSAVEGLLFWCMSGRQREGECKC